MSKKTKPSIDLTLFKHSTKGEVRFSEVDSFGVVHNLAYLYWIEWARTQYLFDVAATKHSDYFTKELPLMTVTSTINYQASLRFADNYEILTRVSRLGESSVAFENVTLGDFGSDKDKVINTATSVLVYVNTKSQESIRFPDEYRTKIESFENNFDQ